MTLNKRFLLALLVSSGVATQAFAQASLVCPQVSGNTSFTGPTMQAECSATVTTGCTSKSGLSWNASSSSLQLPVTAGNFQSLPGATIEENVLFAAIADFDRDGWTDIAAADDYDKHFIMRNQTITCGTSSCSATSVASIPASWWNTLTNVRKASFRVPTNGSGTKKTLKPTATSAGAVALRTPMTEGDFDGDGWPDFVAISVTFAHSSSVTARAKYPTADRLYLNTKNCKNASNVPCGVGMLCSGQASNGACTGSGLSNGTPHNQSSLSCTSSSVCEKFFPTFATYDMRTGAAVSANNAYKLGGTPTAVTSNPGDFGPVNRPTTQFETLDWDGDGDLDLLFGHGVSETYYCPSALCSPAFETNKRFWAGIQVWFNDCAQSAQWNAATKSCAGHIPTFSHPSGACTGTSCGNSDTLIPSTAHNNTTINPQTDLGFDYSPHEVPVFSYKDIDNDGDRDLVLGSVGCCSSTPANRLRIYKNSSGSMYTHMLDTANPISLSTSNGTYGGFGGAATAVFVEDFTLDGLPDLITASDGLSYASGLGGNAYFWANTGDAAKPYGKNWPSCSTTPATCAGCSATCNPNRNVAISNHGSPADDFDLGMVLDYDHDPAGTKDVLLTDGAGGALDFYVFPNRASGATVPACGVAQSGTLPEPTNEATVTGACLTPSASFDNTTSSIRWYLTNEDPANYVYACKQTSAGTTPASCCVSFPNITGKTIRWKAEVDSNSSDDATGNPCSAVGTDSPSLSAVSANYTYNEAAQHYRAGVVVSDGVSYVGSFRQPGNRGHFYGLAAGDGTTYYDAATKIDAQSSRSVYTASNVGTGLSAISFSPSSPSSTLIARVGATTGTEATNIINWVLSKRFGVTAATSSKLGAIMGSTPAILAPPFRPGWYSYMSAADKALYDAFSTANATRVPLALFASMDGMIHAIISKATAITNTVNGTEAWAFVPPYVAAGMKTDYIASCTPSCASGTLSITSYPDGSPTLVDYKKSGGTIATVAIVGDGAGGSSLTALDVTNTVNPTTFALQTAPSPLWSHKPGDANAGKATGKPAVARVKIGGTETFVAIAGTGLNSADTTKGKVVAGYNLETGALLWKFETECPLTSDITVFETDDDTETGTPTIDGFIDRAVFADNCGYVYKINPAQNLSGGYMPNTGYGSIVLTTQNGAARRALFSTTQTGALGAGVTNQRPIVGTIGAKSDTATDMILFFGTGGLESYDVTKTNEFYAVRAKNGTIRNKLTGACSGGRCEKFYGGVVITTDAVILQRSTDALIGGVGSCDYGTSKVQFLNVGTFAQIDVVDEIGGSAIHASAGPLFGDANALYFATVSGQIKQIGEPRAQSAGADTAGGTMNNSTAGGTGYGGPFTLMGWRVVL
ncbi:MAG: hypothetical protein AB7R00_18230 [Kofleriaceae bacterium]